MSSNQSNLVIPPETYRRRRALLGNKLRRPLLILAGRASPRHYPTNTHPFRAGSSYLYFGGVPVEGAAWLIEPGNDGNAGCVLLRPERTDEEIVWLGAPPAREAMAATAGLDPNLIDDSNRLRQLLFDRQAGYVAPAVADIQDWLDSDLVSPAADDELLAIIDLRLRKDQDELAAMRRAAAVSVEAHKAAMGACQSGRTENDVVSAWWNVVNVHGYRCAFTPGITVRGEVLHSEGYENKLEAGQLLLMDAGAEEPGGYTCDITRTVPVSARFDSIQLQLYDTVRKALNAGIRECVPGRRFRDVHDIAASVICEGLVDAGLLRGDPVELAGRRAHRLFFTHGLGHLIGLDVHDLEDFGDLAGYAPGRTRRTEFGDKFLRLDRDLEPGMTLTVEPGLYLVPTLWEQPEWGAPLEDALNRDQINRLLARRFGGIRIEETVSVRSADEGGPECLSGALPTGPEEVCALVGRS